jgi:hypothetical protein
MGNSIRIVLSIHDATPLWKMGNYDLVKLILITLTPPHQAFRERPSLT